MTLRTLGPSVLLLLLSACQAAGSGGDGGGWTDLGSPDHWRGYQKEAVPAAWTFEGGTIHLTGGGAGDLITREQFASFELELEWNISPGGNSGIMYHVSEDHPQTYMSGPEMQVYDDAAFEGDVDLLHSAGADYALYPAVAGSSKPAGEWNAVRIRIDGPRVTYWLNGVEQCSYELWGDEWERRVAESKFAQWPSFGRNETGHVALQDHGNPVWYRNVRIRRL